MKHRDERNQLRHKPRLLVGVTGALALGLLMPSSHAVDQYVDNVLITTVAATGGADTVNAGTTCVKVSVPLPTACVGGYVAILNNNKQLISAAHLSKTLGTPVWLYFDVATTPTLPNYHCPGRAFTQCSVISIESKP